MKNLFFTLFIPMALMFSCQSEQKALDDVSKTPKERANKEELETATVISDAGCEVLSKSMNSFSCYKKTIMAF